MQLRDVLSSLLLFRCIAVTQAQDPDVKCEVKLKDPKPSVLYCGSEGTIENPAHSRASKKSSLELCRDACLNSKCLSFSFDTDNHDCNLYRKTLRNMGYHHPSRQDPTGVKHFNANCFKETCACEYSPVIGVTISPDEALEDGSFEGYYGNRDTAPWNLSEPSPGYDYYAYHNQACRDEESPYDGFGFVTLYGPGFAEQLLPNIDTHADYKLTLRYRVRDISPADGECQLIPSYSGIAYSAPNLEVSNEWKELKGNADWHHVGVARKDIRINLFCDNGARATVDIDRVSLTLK